MAFETVREPDDRAEIHLRDAIDGALDKAKHIAVLAQWIAYARKHIEHFHFVREHSETAAKTLPPYWAAPEWDQPKSDAMTNLMSNQQDHVLTATRA